jgi:hypothetical protein
MSCSLKCETFSPRYKANRLNGDKTGFLFIVVPVKLTVDLDPDTSLKLRAMVKAEGRSVEELVADVLREYANKYKRPRIPGIGEFDSGETDTSELADEILKDAARN